MKSLLAAAMDAAEAEWRRGRNSLSGGLVARDPLVLEASAKRFIKFRTREILGVGDEPLVEGEGCIQMPLGGVRSLVRFVTLEGRKICVRVYPLNKRQEAETHCDAALILQKNGLNAPRFLAFVDEPKRYQALFVVEEFIELVQIPAAQLSSKHIRSLAIQLAKLHSIHRNVWGSLEQPRRELFFHPLMRRIGRQLSFAKREGLIGSSAERQEMLDWFRSFEPVFRSISDFGLTHGQLHAGNGLFSMAGEFHFLDHNTLEYAVPIKDVIEVHHTILGNLQEKISNFQEIYSELIPDSWRKAQDQLKCFYEALSLLTLITMRSKRLQTHQHIPREFRLQRRAAEWNQFQELLTAHRA